MSDKLKVGGADSMRRIDTTVEDLRPAAPASKPVIEVELQCAPPAEKKRAPLIELFGAKIDLEKIRDRVTRGLGAVADPLIISFIINATGSAFAYFAMGVPFDAKLAATYGAIGTVIGAAYFPAKQALIKAMKSSPPEPGGEPEAP